MGFHGYQHPPEHQDTETNLKAQERLQVSYSYRGLRAACPDLNENWTFLYKKVDR